jgi:hypothetical protein
MAVAAGLAAGAVLWSGGDGDATAAAPRADDLFVVDGRLTSARSTGQSTLEVSVRRSTVLWFSDRPARLNGNRPIGTFVAEWPSIFRGDPPNAVVLAPSDDRSRRPIAVELQRPTFDRSTGVVRFQLRRERRSGRVATDWLARWQRAPRSARGRLVLFIDGGSPPSPAATVAAAFAQGMEAIDVLRAAAAGGGTVAGEAAADLEQLRQAATSP